MVDLDYVQEKKSFAMGGGKALEQAAQRGDEWPGNIQGALI